ncbi:MAG: hypothetical protein J1E85_08060, partial [Ruminococcus sp.]|nr:hypothetical protein [Ruminococcus sp.]
TGVRLIVLFYCLLLLDRFNIIGGFLNNKNTAIKNMTTVLEYKFIFKNIDFKIFVFHRYMIIITTYSKTQFIGKSLV